MNVGKTEENGKERKRLKRWRMMSSSGKEIKQRRTMRFWFIVVICVLFAITCVFSALLFYVLTGILASQKIYLDGAVLISAMALSCIIIGSALSVFSSKYMFVRITKVSEGMREVAKGNFSTRVKERDKSEALSEFGELERTFNRMASDLEGIEIFRNDFINNFSHEFKTPIVSIRGFARQLQSDSLSDAQKKEYVDIIVTESERLANMSSNVLLLSKLENQQIVSDKTEFYLDEQIRKCILLLEKSWSDKGIELDIDLDEIRYTFNEEMLSHIWINLISNAIKFTSDGGRISCDLHADGESIVFTVSDSGIGMSEETLSHIFEKFYQGDKSHSTLGNGIGLNIVSRIVTLAHGDIKVESEVGKGSIFTVTLPNQQE